MNAYDRAKNAANKRVAKGKSKWVRVSDLEPGMVLWSHGMEFSHNETVTDPNHCGNVVKFANGLGFSEKLDTMVEVVISR